MAWHHHVERFARGAKHAASGARHHGVRAVGHFPTVAAILSVVGIVAIGEVLFGKSTTPPPSQQDKT
jgi:hypothetical protein